MSDSITGMEGDSMDIKKRKQHYVFQAYLRAWATDEQICCIRNEGTPFKTNTINVTQERDFYRIKPLNDDEIKCLNLFLQGTHPDVQKEMAIHTQAYLEPLKDQEKLQQIKMIVEVMYGGEDKIPSAIRDGILELKETIDVSLNNIMEDYYSDIEGEATKWIELLKEERADFYYSVDKEKEDTESAGDEKFDFLYFLCAQYFRTKAIKERWSSVFETCLQDPRWSALNIRRENIRPDNLSHHFFWQFQNSCAYSLRKRNAHLTILTNRTSIPFITSDQPLVNLKADYQNLSSTTKELIFYYPISPNVAITINDENSKDKIDLSEQQVDEYNRIIVNASYQNILANDIAVLKRYK